MVTSELINEILPALNLVKTKLQAVSKKANNPFFKSKYADLNTYLDEVEPLLEENGLVLLQPTVSALGTDGTVVISRIYHVASGQYIESSMRLVGDNDMQKSGSGITYARRYTLGALLSMKAEDDDANRASNKETPSTKSYSAKAAAPAATPSQGARPSFKRPTPKATAAPTQSSGDDI